MKKNKQEREHTMKNEKKLVQEKEEKLQKEEQQPKEIEETLEEQFEQLQNDYTELNDKLLRTAAEYENFRRRSVTEKSNWIKYATERLIMELCDVLDNFERALEQNKDNHDEQSFRKGIQLIYKQLNELLKKEGVTKIDALHKEFDPNYHEALARIPSDKEENIVVAVIQNGYLMNNKVIRPVRVAVSNGETPKEKNKKNT
jgi:molecular chaperone GrpE